METTRFDTLTKTIGLGTPRRSVLQLMLALCAVVLGLGQEESGAASRCHLVCRQTSHGRRCRRVCRRDDSWSRCSAGFITCAAFTPGACRRVCRRRDRRLVCRRVCSPGRTSATCVDPRIDPRNCGACGHTCNGACSAGRCVAPPPPIDEICAPYGEACFSTAGCCDDMVCLRGTCR